MAQLVNPTWRLLGMGPATVQVTAGDPLMVNQNNLGAGQIIKLGDAPLSLPAAAPIWGAPIWLSGNVTTVVVA